MDYFLFKPIIIKDMFNDAILDHVGDVITASLIIITESCLNIINNQKYKYIYIYIIINIFNNIYYILFNVL